MLVHSDVTCSLGRQYHTLVGQEMEGGSLLFRLRFVAFVFFGCTCYCFLFLFLRLAYMSSASCSHLLVVNKIFLSSSTESNVNESLESKVAWCSNDGPACSQELYFRRLSLTYQLYGYWPQISLALTARKS